MLTSPLPPSPLLSSPEPLSLRPPSLGPASLGPASLGPASLGPASLGPASPAQAPRGPFTPRPLTSNPLAPSPFAPAARVSAPPEGEARPTPPGSPAPETPLPDPLPLAALPAALAAGAVLVDVREEDERALFGAIPGAIALPLLALRAALGERLTPEEAELLEGTAPASAEALLRPLRARPAPLVLCFCAHGQRARRAARLLAAQGFPARALDAGFSDLRAALGPASVSSAPASSLPASLADASPAALTAAA